MKNSIPLKYRIRSFFYSIYMGAYIFLHTTRKERKRRREYEGKIRRSMDELIPHKNPTEEEMCDALLKLIDKIQNKEIEY